MAKVQLIVEQPITSTAWTRGNLKRGDVVWVDDGEPARHLIEHGLCRWPAAAKKVEDGKPMRRPDGWPTDRFAVVERAWEGATVVCIAGGPSLTHAQLQIIADARAAGRCKAIAINDAYLVAPWADICYFADARWWEWHTKGIAKAWPWVRFSEQEVRQAFAAFAGQKVTIGDTGMMVADADVFMLHNQSSEVCSELGLSETPNALRTGSNSGYQAVNLALLAGAKRVALVAYDMRYAGRKTHSHDGHPIKQPEGSYLQFARNFASMVPQLGKLGVEVLNCTPDSAIDAFKREALARVLADS